MKEDRKEELQRLMERLTVEDLMRLYEYTVKIAAEKSGDPRRG